MLSNLCPCILLTPNILKVFFLLLQMKGIYLAFISHLDLWHLDSVISISHFAVLTKMALVIGLIFHSKSYREVLRNQSMKTEEI